jgi:transposase InsO family protein
LRYPFIEENRGQFSVETLCRVLEVSPRGYYAWRRRCAEGHESRRERDNRKLLVEIETLHHESNQTYGSPRMYRQLKKQGHSCSENRVARLMRRNGIQATRPRPFKVTTDSCHRLPIAENTLDRQFTPEQANQVWASDITYVWTREGWLYLAIVIDLFSRRVVGWSMQQSMERSLVISALEMALAGRRPGVGLLHHSDRGSQYASLDYQARLRQAGIVSSMSRKGNCWDNAPVESFFATLKRELVHRRRYESREQARLEIFRYIEVWYNRKRLHSALGYLAPVEYERAKSLQPVKMAA